MSLQDDTYATVAAALRAHADMLDVLHKEPASYKRDVALGLALSDLLSDLSRCCQLTSYKIARSLINDDIVRALGDDIAQDNAAAAEVGK